MHYWHRAKGFVVLRYWIVTKESSYPSSLISLHSQYSSPSLSLSSFSNRHPRQQKNNRTVAITEQQQSSEHNNRTEQQQNNQRQSGSHETLSSTESHFFSDFDGWKLERTWRGNRSTSIECRAHGGVPKNVPKLVPFFLYVFFVLTFQPVTTNPDIA